MALKIKCSSSEKLPHQVLCGVRSSQVAERLGKAVEGKQSRAAFSSFPSRMSSLASALVPRTEDGQRDGMLHKCSLVPWAEEEEDGGNRWRGAAYITIAHCH